MILDKWVQQTSPELNWTELNRAEEEGGGQEGDKRATGGRQELAGGSDKFYVTSFLFVCLLWIPISPHYSGDWSSWATRIYISNVKLNIIKY